MTTAATPRESTPRPGTATDRLQRLLALVPYVVSRNVVGLADTAAAFGVTEHQLVDDLNMLWCVELRSPDPYCPIDLSYEGGEIVVSQAESIDRPLRLGVDEASALLVALRMLAERMPDLALAGPVRRRNTTTIRGPLHLPVTAGRTALTRPPARKPG